MERTDVRTIVGGGIKLGLITAVGVAAFALLSRGMTGTTETLVQSALVLAGGLVFSYYPALQVHPRTADSIAWAALVGLLGALAFTVIDTAVLRPLDLYHWTWDEIGGGSGFWYIPVWWMGAALLAWLGSWVVAEHAARGATPSPGVIAAWSLGLALVVAALLMGTGLAPFTTAAVALAFVLGLGAHVVVARFLSGR
jgi:hypothetical protein